MADTSDDSVNENTSMEAEDDSTDVKVNIRESSKTKLMADLSSVCDVTLGEAEAMLEIHNWKMEEAVDAFLNGSESTKVELAGALRKKILDNDSKKARVISDLSAICDVSEDVAIEMLERYNWDVQTAIDKYLESERLKHGEDVDTSDQNGLDDGPAESANSPSTSTNSGINTIASPMTTSTWAPEQFSILSWNLDGLDSKNLEKRTAAVVDEIEKENYSILFFQELLPETFDYVAKRLVSKYLPLLGTENPSCGYLTATFLRLHHIIYEDHYIVKYPNTSMERNVLVTKAFSGRAKLCLLNTHLESTAEFADERVNQLQQCFNLCRSFSPEYNVIFGGDLNLRDKEVSNRIPSNMCDLWEKCGARSSARFTWDLKRNTNKQMPSKHQPSCRFDRLYFRNSDPVTIEPEFFGVTGLEKVAGTQSFPSDHWGIISFFRLEHEARKPQTRKRKAENSAP